MKMRVWKRNKALFGLFILVTFFLTSAGSDISNTETKVYVALTKENNYTDQLEHGVFTRSATSGTGTGRFIGRGFEFAKGSCPDLDQSWLSAKGWRPHTLGCGRMLLESDWCARLRADHSVRYTLRFLSWTIGPEKPNQRCLGKCKENNNRTTYMRIREP